MQPTNPMFDPPNPLLDAARALHPPIGASADRIEPERQLPPSLVDEMAAAVTPIVRRPGPMNMARRLGFDPPAKEARMAAAEQYAGRVDAFAAQRTRWRGGRRGDRWTPILAEQARDDPHRPLDANLQALASYIDPADLVIDVGGGAGRVCLPLALRCRDVVNVDPAPAMQAAFEQSAHDAGITNVRFVQGSWPSDPPITGDVVLATQVTYFVRDIVPFIQQLDAAARRRVIIGIWSVPPPVQGEAIFELLFGGPFVRPPGHRELLPVLWDLGILPDVRVLPMPMRRTFAWPPQPTREQMVEWAVRYILSLGAVTESDARAKITAHYDALFMQDVDGYGPRWRTDVREMLITWEPRR